MAPRDGSATTGARKRRASIGGSKGPTASAGAGATQASTGKHPSAPPLEPPTFTIKDVREAVPAHCFERSAVRSLMYTAWDLLRVGFVGYLATYISGTADSIHPYAPYVLWPLYWVVNGIQMTGIWVLAHECGHQAFSPSKTLNDAVGLVLHSALLVPYHSWRISHGHHHKYTASIEDDEVFLPATRSEFVTEMIEETPLVSLFGIVNMLLFGWPLYLALNIAGPKKYRGMSGNSHFHPSGPLFDKRDYWDIVVSDIAWLVAVAGIVWSVREFGFSTVACFYLIPYLIVNYHLVMITYLQHTDTYIPHYRRPSFTFLKGALSTVDRSFGSLYDSCIHHISSTHVAHHLFSQMPHYHAQEATEALKKLLGPYYLKDDTSIWGSLWNSWRTCRFVEDEGDVVFYKGPQQF